MRIRAVLFDIEGTLLDTSDEHAVGPFHGARVLVDRLRSRGLICAAVAAAPSDHIAELLRAAGVGDLIDTVVSLDDGPREDLIAIALDRIGVEGEEVILIGDTPHDIEGAKRNGVASIALRCGALFTDAQLQGAVAIYDDPADLSAQLDRSPLALDRASDPPPSPMRLRPARIAV